eukprot:TRINITY_DN5960_c0_g1_i4.p1 TRINITY_DN5960_c0_g1~~TRINITY_DN5960_c0_g1_i4.p1  ORF type:complete len:294 (-),score=50.83 TRINITY_DN5960_c0_g1_i4:468-1349(-)
MPIVERQPTVRFSARNTEERVRILENIAATMPRSFSANRACGPLDEAEAEMEHKTIHFMRHGQGEHNVAQARWQSESRPGVPYSWPDNDPDMLYLDAVLSDKGVEEAAQAHAHLVSLEPQPQLLVCSTMRRATMTCLSAWQHLVGRVDLLAHEGCHEMGGKHTCDKRLDLDQLKHTFPQVDYSLVVSEEDPLWSTERESWDHLAQRALGFMKWLMDRPEKVIAVTCHGSFLITLFIVVLGFPASVEQAFHTAEIRSVHVLDSAAERARRVAILVGLFNRMDQDKNGRLCHDTG